jgi:hypothetical protein
VSGRSTWRPPGLALWIAGYALSGAVAAAQPPLLDTFDTIEGWSAAASPGATVQFAPDAGLSGGGLRVDFTLPEGGGYARVRKEFALKLPANYAFTFDLRGDAPPINCEFKLVDPSQRNVWWRNRPGFVLPADWQRLTVTRSRLVQAWGPSTQPLARVGAIEFAVSDREARRGTLWLDNLGFEAREPSGPDTLLPTAMTSSVAEGAETFFMLDGDADTRWQSRAFPEDQWVLVDFGQTIELGGLVIEWAPQDYATHYHVTLSIDGVRWTTVHTAVLGNGERDYVYLPEAETRFIRLELEQSSRGAGYGITALTVMPFEFSRSPNHLFEHIARDAPIGFYPKYFYGRQTYWTVTGVSGDRREALLSEEGQIEVDRGSFSIEPFLWLDDTLVTWNAVAVAQELDEGYLPIPAAIWQHGGLRLVVTAWVAGPPDASVLYASYRIENRGAQPLNGRLFLALRPFQVLPPWQSLNLSGGVTPIASLTQQGRTVWVNNDRPVVSLTPPAAFGASTFGSGAITEFLRFGTLPAESDVYDSFGFASGALAYPFTLDPGAKTEVLVAVPSAAPTAAALERVPVAETAAHVAREREHARADWHAVLAHTEWQLPPAAQRLVRTVKTTLAHILINRDGAAIQPGSRNYARSWIRDGAFTAGALLQFGYPAEVRDFLAWYAQFQGVDGRVPCCVDERGPDFTPEHDSHGEFIYAVMEYYRYTRDVGFLGAMWPRVVAAVGYITALRQQRLTDEFRDGAREAFFGLLPESISHEGYTAHPVHSYWDDFFALRGVRDAVAMAAVVGDEHRAEEFAQLHAAFRRDLLASIEKTITKHGIDYIPGSAELGDFDPTSTAIVLAVDGDAALLPQATLARTFDRYYEIFARRQRGASDWDAYTPYELRNVEALLRLGQRERAFEVLEYFLRDQRPAAWNQWAEVVWRDPGVPKFIGDMPHTWVGSGFLRALRSLFVYERGADAALVVGAGVPAEWVTHGAEVAVKRLPTHYGVLNYSLRAEGPKAVRLRLGGDVLVPAGRIAVYSPLTEPLRAVTVNGIERSDFEAHHVVIDAFPAEIVFEVSRPALRSPGEADLDGDRGASEPG